MDYIDKQFAKHGYKFISSDRFGTYYEKKDNELNYISELAIIPKTSGKYII